MRFKHILFYAVYGLTAFFIFLVVLFPKERAANILCEQINAGFVDGQIGIEEVLPVFPLGLKASHSNILFNDGNQIKMESIALYPEILSLYKDVKKIDVKAQAYGGKIDGSVRLGKVSTQLSESNRLEKTSDKPYDIDFQMELQDIDIKNLKHSLENFDISSSFVINGNLNYRTYIDNITGAKSDNIVKDNNRGIITDNASDSSAGSGSGKMALSQCNLRSNNIFLQQIGIGKVNFTNVDIEWAKNQNILSIQNFDAKGADIKIRLKGDITFKIPQEKSTLNLKGELQPFSANISSSISKLTSGLVSLKSLFSGSSKGTIPFTITGTLQKPIVTPLP
ncbi:MAG: type II secretion system protein GspN [Desulfamplus sp.]|nr:type II secretion system protein GspN [Desulfamplus sp.]